jgi:hypothetical protein
MAEPSPVMPVEERLTATLRVNLSPTEYDQVQTIAKEEERTVSFVARRAVRDMLNRQTEVARLRVALTAYRSALRSGEPETEGLRAVGDAALGSVPGE